MADLSAQFRREFGLPVADGVGAAVKQAEALVALGLKTGKRGAYALPARTDHAGLDARERIEAPDSLQKPSTDICPVPTEIGWDKEGERFGADELIQRSQRMLLRGLGHAPNLS